jgi:hypothetical protein
MVACTYAGSFLIICGVLCFVNDYHLSSFQSRDFRISIDMFGRECCWFFDFRLYKWHYMRQQNAYTRYTQTVCSPITTVYSDPRNQTAVQSRVSFCLFYCEIPFGLCSALYINMIKLSYPLLIPSSFSLLAPLGRHTHRPTISVSVFPLVAFPLVSMLIFFCYPWTVYSLYVAKPFNPFGFDKPNQSCSIN